MYRGYYNIHYSYSTPEIIRGVIGIAFLFGVSESTVYRWAKTWLAPALWKEGRYLVADTEKAVKLFSLNMLGGREICRKPLESYLYQ